ncbi:MAG: dockerin type I repeat-containing protein, partial [Planctomycetota bacterium]
TLALYDLTFNEAGDYTAYYRARGFSTATNSFFTPTDFATDPDLNETVSSDGVFAWEVGDAFTVTSTHVGMPLELRLGKREGLTQLDAIIFHQDDSLTAAQLDALLAAQGLAGDYNLDGVVNAADYTVWADNFGSSSNLAADGNGDGVVNAADYTVWADNFGAQLGTLNQPATIPEPGTLTCLLGALLLSSRRITKIGGMY